MAIVAIVDITGEEATRTGTAYRTASIAIVMAMAFRTAGIGVLRIRTVIDLYCRLPRVQPIFGRRLVLLHDKGIRMTPCKGEGALL
jgi:hypothetical protein